MVVKLIFVYGPHEKVAECDVGERNDVRASDDDGSTRDAVVDCACPVVEREAA